MKKGFTSIKNFVQDIQITSRGEKSDVLSNDLINAEKRVDLLKQASQNAEKKIAICLQGAGTGTDPSSMDKRFKKMPEAHLHFCFQEFGDHFGTDSVLGKTLAESSDIQKGLTKELLSHELELEKQCLLPLNSLLENDIPAVLRSRKTLNKAIQDMDNYRQRYHAALKQSHQVTGSTATVAAANKAESLKKEWDESSTKVEQTKDAYAAEVFSLVSREPEFAYMYLQYFKLQGAYHRRALELLEASVPKLEDIILNTAQKPAFGTPLDEHLRVTEKEISLVLESCIAWLLHHVDEEGLFRIPGSTSKVKKLKSSFDAGLVDCEEYVRDPHTVAGTLKSYLRELPEPLLTYAHYAEWIEAAKVNDPQLRLQALWQVLYKLPKANFANLCYLVKFLAKLCSHSDSNKMSPQNIAIAMAPSLIWGPNLDNDEAALGLNMTAASHHNIEFVTIPNYVYYGEKGSSHSGVNGDIERSTSFNAGDSLNSSTSSKTSVHRPTKKPAPPAPPTHGNFTTNGTSSGAPNSPKGLECTTLERKESLTSRRSENNNGSCTIGTVTAALPRKTLQKPERPSLRPHLNNHHHHNYHSVESASSSNEAVDSAGDKSPSSESFTTGSLDRKSVASRSAVDLSKPRDRKSMFIPRHVKLESRPSVPPPSVPRNERPLSVIERPTVPPPERPIRSIDGMKKQHSLENLCERGGDEPEVSSSLRANELYPDLVKLVDDLGTVGGYRAFVATRSQSSTPPERGRADEEGSESPVSNGSVGDKLVTDELVNVTTLKVSGTSSASDCELAGGISFPDDIEGDDDVLIVEQLNGSSVTKDEETTEGYREAEVEVCETPTSKLVSNIATTAGEELATRTGVQQQHQAPPPAPEKPLRCSPTTLHALSHNNNNNNDHKEGHSEKQQQQQVENEHQDENCRQQFSAIVNSFNRRSADGQDFGQSEGGVAKPKPPRPLPPVATKPRITSVSEASHL